jgi:trimeric autotransporter adhesin
MRYRIPVVVLAAVAVFGYGCVQGKVLTDPATTTQSSSATSNAISLLVINPTTISGTVGQTTQLTASALNQSSQPISGTTFTWASSNTQVASVAPTGLVTLVGAGSANITASAGGLTTSVPATATAAPVQVAAVKVTPSALTLNPGNTSQLAAVTTDALGNTLTGQPITWSSSNTSVASISTSGLVSAVAVGSTVITATSGSKSGTATVTVVAQSQASVASVTITPATASVATGGTTQFTATLKDSVGNVLGGRTVTWSSSNSSVASVSATGLATGVASGTATISASTGGQQGTAQVTVNPVPVASVVVTPGSANLSAYQTLQLIATPENASGSPIGGQTITWSSSDPYTASVSSTGLVTVIKTGGIGYTIISATTGGQTGTSTINLIAAPVATVTLSPTSVTLNASQTAQLTATAKDQYGDVITTDPASWSSSNTSVATVSSSGLVTATGSGSATITVTIGGMSATANVTVSQAAVASVTMSPTTLSLAAGASSGLTATAYSSSGGVLTGYAQSWSSSNTSAATVSSSGVVTGVAAGSATITATIGGKSATAAVTVTAAQQQTVASVTLAPGTSSLQVGNQVQLSATDKTSNGTVVTGQSVTWSSSNSAVASVTSSGLVTGSGVGTATITAASGGQQGTASITVTAGTTGPYHEPAGMTPQINTGAMSVAPSQSYEGTWTEGTTTFTNFSPNTMSSVGEWAGNISSIPGETGLRLAYNSTLDGGNSPVRFGAGFQNSGTGYLYIRWMFRLSSNWTLSQASQLKVMEPRTINLTENHVISFSPYGQPSDGSNMWPNAFLQFTTGSGTTSLYVPGNSEGQDASTSYFTSSVANVGGSARGTWHTIEFYFQPESPAGSATGQLTIWVDGTQVYQTTSVNFFLSGEAMGWNYLMFDPCYGGDAATDHPPGIYWDIDQLYVSTK